MKKSALIFLIFFILLTFAPIPVYTLFREQIGYKNTENKSESPFPDLTRQNFSTWPKRFESWLSDLLPFKTQFIEIYRGFQLYSGLDFTQSDVIRGKNGFLFYRKTVENYKGIRRFSDEELEQIERNLNGFFSEMEEKGVQCLLFIAPDKEQVYSEQMPDSIRRITNYSQADQLVNYLKERVSFPVLYPKGFLQDLSAEMPVYFNTDTHWNNLGGWAAAETIKSAFTGFTNQSSLPSYHQFESEGKDLAVMLGLSEALAESNEAEIEFDDGLQIHKTQTINYGSIQRFTSDDRPDNKVQRLLIIGDSFAEYYLRSAIHDIKDILFVTYGDLSLIDLDAEIPDYLVVMLVERNLPFLLDPIQ